jgi:hypothetical protein
LSRISYERADGVLHIVIGPRRNTSNAIFGVVFPLMLVLGMLAVGALLSGWSPSSSAALRSNSAFIFFCVWSIFFVTIAGLGTFNWLLGIWGHWEIVLSDNVLTRTAEIFSIRRSRSFLVQNIANVRINERQGGKGLVLRTIVFDCGGKAFHSTPALSADEAHELLAGPLAILNSRQRGGPA